MRVGPFRSVYVRQATVAWFLAFLVLAALAVLAVRPWALLAVFAVLILRWVWDRLRARRREEALPADWAYAARMTYALPESPAFRSAAAHRAAVRRICAYRGWPVDEIALRAGMPRPFVEAVLSYLPDDRGEGGAGVGARLLPKGPGPLSAAE